MRVNVDITSTNINDKNLEYLNIKSKQITKEKAIKLIADKIIEKIDLNNQFCENKILKKKITLDIYNSSVIDLVKQKIEALQLPMFNKMELLSLLDDSDMASEANVISAKLKVIIQNEDESGLQYFFRKQFDFRIKVDRITLEDIKTLFEDLFNNTFVRSEVFYQMFLENNTIGYITNGQSYYYQNDVFKFLTNINNYKECLDCFKNQTPG